ncbi:MAG: D-alanine--D-alanine ligase family protein [Candidatus Paceibacterota bacterium]
MMKNKKLTIAVLMGGRSAEHEVSLQSARNIVNALDKNKYTVVPIGITRDGKWFVYKNMNYLLHAEDPKKIKLAGSNLHCTFSIERKGVLEISDGTSKKIDVVFPVLHGPYGEDGSMQGYLKLAGVPFVGAGVLGSAVGMDKDVMKRLLTVSGIKNARAYVLHVGEKITYQKVSALLGNTLFVKPANLGSSVGVSKVRNTKEFNKAVTEALLYDRKILIEEAVPGRELECAVLGNEKPIASVVGEVVLTADFYSYDAKYIDSDGARTDIPAVGVPKDVVQKIQKIAVDTYRALCCEGLGRVDVFLRPDGEIYVNEINTLPGFTAISMYPKLFRESGLPVEHLLDRLIKFALARHTAEEKLKN